MTLVIGQSGQMECNVISTLHPHIEWIYDSCGFNCSEDAVSKVMVVFCMTCLNCSMKRVFYLNIRILLIIYDSYIGKI